MDDSECTAFTLRLQKQIVEAVHRRPQYRFRELIFLCWKKSGKFVIAKMTDEQLAELLSAIEQGEIVPPSFSSMEEAVCNRKDCGYLTIHLDDDDHVPTCRVQKFRKAIVE